MTGIIIKLCKDTCDISLFRRAEVTLPLLDGQFVGEHAYIIISYMRRVNIINYITTNQFILYQGAVNEGRGLEVLIPAMKNVNSKLMICRMKINLSYTGGTEHSGKVRNGFFFPVIF